MLIHDKSYACWKVNRLMLKNVCEAYVLLQQADFVREVGYMPTLDG